VLVAKAGAAVVCPSCQTLGVMHTSFRTPPRGLRPAIVAIGATVHLSFLFQIFTVKSAAGFILPLVVLLPWLFLLASMHLAQNRLRAEYISLFATAVYLVFGAWAFWDTIYVHPDPQGGLVFLVVPVAASIAALVLLLALLLTKRKSTVPQATANDA